MPPKAKANAKETKAGPGLHGHKDNERTRKTHLWVLSFLGQFNFCWDVALGPGIGCLPTCNFPLGLASKKRPPQVRFDLLEMPVLKGENRTCGGLFSQANPSGKLALPTGNFGTRPFLCLKSYKLSSKGRVQKLPLRVCWPFLVPQEVDRTKGYIGS